MTFNVNRQIQDVFYRYKMPRLATKIEGKGNGIKTVIVNMSDVAKALVRDPALPTKYFGVVLGAQVQTDDKTDRYIVNGSHQCDKLQDILDGFIKNYVLCPSCLNPETTFQVKLKNVSARCKACGHQYKLKPDRITQYIIKNPPKKETTKLQAQGNESDEKDEEPTEVEVNGYTTLSSADANSKKAHEDVVWSVDNTEEAAAERALNLSSAVRGMTVNANIESLGMHERASIMLDFLRSKVSREEDSSEIPVDKAIAIKSESDRLELGYRTVGLCVETLLDRPNNLLEDLVRARNVFLRFTRSNAANDQPVKAQTYFLDCMFVLVEQYPSLVNGMMKFTEQLYDLDIVEEEQICDWYEASINKKLKRKPMRAQLLEKIKPLVEWLRNAEEESDDEEELSDEPDANDSVKDSDIEFCEEDNGLKQSSAVVEDQKELNGVKGDGEVVNSDATADTANNGASAASRLLEMDDDDDDIDLNDI